MDFCKSINKAQLVNLLTGMLGIYVLYFIAGILHQSLVKRPHYNRITQIYQVCNNTAGLITIPFIFGWVMGAVYNKISIQNPVKIPHKNSFLTALAVVAATYFSLLAMQKTSFPVVIMFQSCSIVPVVFIAVFCSRVHDPNLKLGPKKIIVTLIITAGILTFQFADPQTKQRQKKDQFIGILFLIFHFVAEGFLPDLQAEIKVNFKPAPTEMMAEINKWCALFSLIICLVTWSLWSFIIYLSEHFSFTIDLILMSIVSGFGQFFIYRMIKQFKQHFVPFTISSRKILTVAISIVFYGHQTNWIQILGICVVLFTIFVQFITEISKPQPVASANTDAQNRDVQLNQENIQNVQISSNNDSESKEKKIDKDNSALEQKQYKSKTNVNDAEIIRNQQISEDIKQNKKEKDSELSQNKQQV